MNNLQSYARDLFKWVLAAVLLAPAAGWGHGAVETPPSRALNCYVTGGHWGSANGSSIKDEGCREAFTKTFNSRNDWAIAADQWHEVAKIPNINHPTLDQIKAIIPDGHICAANDPKKASLDYPTPLWTKYKENVVPGQSLAIRLVGTILHVPSTFYAFITRPGFNSATDVLKWSDLIALGGPERLEKAYTNWNPPALLPGLAGFYVINRTIPSNASGNGLVVGIWVRDDPNGEFFISCSDVRFQSGGVPDPLTNIGPYIGPDMQSLKVGDSVHFRIFGVDAKGTELVDITQKIRTDNLAPAKWGLEIANQVPPAIAKIGVKTNGTVTFNSANPQANATYATNPHYKQVMSIITGGGETPDQRPPTANFQGPTEAKEGETVTFDGRSSVGHNGPLTYIWSTNASDHASPPPNHQSTFSFKVGPYVDPVPGAPQPNYIIKLGVYDAQNGKNGQKETTFVIKKAGDNDGFPQWIRDGGYNSGSQVSNHGVKYRCKQGSAGAWCGQNENEPGKPNSTFWQRAWDVVP